MLESVKSIGENTEWKGDEGILGVVTEFLSKIVRVGFTVKVTVE